MYNKVPFVFLKQQHRCKYMNITTCYPTSYTRTEQRGGSRNVLPHFSLCGSISFESFTTRKMFTHLTSIVQCFPYIFTGKSSRDCIVSGDSTALWEKEGLWPRKGLDSNPSFTRYVALNQSFRLSKPQFPFCKRELY